MILRWRWSRHGAHVRVRVFTAPALEAPGINVGFLVFRQEEWDELAPRLIERCGPLCQGECGHEIVQEDPSATHATRRALPADDLPPPPPGREVP